MTVERLIEILLTCPQNHTAFVAVDGKLLDIDAIAEYLPDAGGEPVVGIECEDIDLTEDDDGSPYKRRETWYN